MDQKLKSGELPITYCTPQDGDAARRNRENIRHNLRLRQQRGGGFGYLLDAEAEYLLRGVP